MIDQPFLKSCILVTCIGFSGCSLTPSTVSGTGVTEIELSRAIENISFNRDIAENYVSVALAKFRDKPDLAKVVQDKYGHAAALGNSFIDKLKFSLTVRKIDADELARDVKQVAAAVNELNAEINPPLIGTEGEPTASAITELLTPAAIDSIVKSVLTVRKAAQDRDDKLIEDTKKELDKLRWKSWRELDKVV